MIFDSFNFQLTNNIWYSIRPKINVRFNTAPFTLEMVKIFFCPNLTIVFEFEPLWQLYPTLFSGHIIIYIYFIFYNFIQPLCLYPWEALDPAHISSYLPRCRWRRACHPWRWCLDPDSPSPPPSGTRNTPSGTSDSGVSGTWVGNIVKLCQVLIVIWF